MFTYFRFDKVPLVTPNGDVLVKEMNFEVCHDNFKYYTMKKTLKLESI
mgnify:CR=1 FL=1